jgi:hypothetical protein
MKLKLETYYRTWPISLAAIAHLAEGQFLQEEQTVNRIIIIIQFNNSIIIIIIIKNP